MMLRLSILRFIVIILSHLFDSDFDYESDKNLTKVLISSCVTLCLIFILIRYLWLANLFLSLSIAK